MFDWLSVDAMMHNKNSKMQQLLSHLKIESFKYGLYSFQLSK